MLYQDHDGNIVHHFNIPGRHSRLVVDAEALVECPPPADLPDDAGCRRAGSASTRSRPRASSGICSNRARSPAARRARQARAEIGLERGDDPLDTLRRLMAGDARALRVRPQDDARRLADRRRARRAAGRVPGLRAHHDRARPPARRALPLRQRLSVSAADDGTRSVDGATHAWVEALLPDLGWVGFDPTNNLIAGEHHIRVAVGRDYADVPPTRGVFKGSSAVRSELAVAASRSDRGGASGRDTPPFVPWMSHHVATLEGRRRRGSATTAAIRVGSRFRFQVPVPGSGSGSGSQFPVSNALPQREAADAEKNGIHVSTHCTTRVPLNMSIRTQRQFRPTLPA